MVEFSTEVEHMPQNTEVVGSNPAICSSFYPLRHTFLNRFLCKVQVTYYHYKMEAYLSSLRRNKLNVHKLVNKVSLLGSNLGAN